MLVEISRHLCPRPFAACGCGTAKRFGSGADGFALRGYHHRNSAPRTGVVARGEKAAGVQGLRAGTAAGSGRSYRRRVIPVAAGRQQRPRAGDPGDRKARIRAPQAHTGRNRKRQNRTRAGCGIGEGCRKRGNPGRAGRRRKILGATRTARRAGQADDSAGFPGK